MKRNIDSDWLELEYGVHLNVWWLEFGLKILCSNENYYNSATEIFFKVNRKTTLYKHPIPQKTTQIEDKNSISQLVQLPPNHPEVRKRNFQLTLSIFTILNEFSQKNHGTLLMQSIQDEEFYLESTEKQEIFVPFLLKNNNNQANHFYLSLALNNPLDSGDFKEKFHGFRRFVTAGCLFGASLQAIDKKGAIFPIIQHKIAFVEGEQIIKLNPPDKALHPYEIAQFNDLKDAIPLMEKMANKDAQAEVLYHLPNFDYILSAIKLYIHNKITYEALEDFYIAIKERSKKHISIIKDIFKGKNLTLLLESPFMNLANDFFMNDDNYNITYIKCLDKFNAIIAEENRIYVSIKNGYLIYKILSPMDKQEGGSTDIAYKDQIFPPLDTSKTTQQLLRFITNKGHARGINAFLSCLEIPIQTTKFLNHKKMEQEVAQKIVDLLCSNGFSSKHASVWEDIVKINFGRDKIRCIETLFKTANAVMIAVAARSFEDYKVCSFLPFNESPIFRKYKRCKEQFAALNISYPEVFSLTRLENLIFYSHISEGNVFYFQRNTNQLDSLLNHETLMNYTVKANNFSEQAVD